MSDKAEDARAELIELAWRAFKERRRNGEASLSYAQTLREMGQARRVLDRLRGGSR